MSDEPKRKPAAWLAPDLAIRPDAADFVEQPDLSTIPPQHEKLPVWLYLICGLALFLAGSSYAGIEFGPGYYDRGVGGPAEPELAEAPAVAESTDPMVVGKRLYEGNCANCHQKTGAGQPGSYPPMVGSEWVIGNKPMLASILLDGVAGPLSVHGDEYGSNVMPAWANLSNDNLAAIMTYIRKSWGNAGDDVKPEDVAAARTQDASRTSPWAESDLMKMKAEK